MLRYSSSAPLSDAGGVEIMARRACHTIAPLSKYFYHGRSLRIAVVCYTASCLMAIEILLQNNTASIFIEAALLLHIRVLC